MFLLVANCWTILKAAVRLSHAIPRPSLHPKLATVRTPFQIATCTDQRAVLVALESTNNGHKRTAPTPVASATVSTVIHDSVSPFAFTADSRSLVSLNCPKLFFWLSININN